MDKVCVEGALQISVASTARMMDNVTFLIHSNVNRPISHDTTMTL